MQSAATAPLAIARAEQAAGGGRSIRGTLNSAGCGSYITQTIEFELSRAEIECQPC